MSSDMEGWTKPNIELIQKLSDWFKNQICSNCPCKDDCAKLNMEKMACAVKILVKNKKIRILNGEKK